jgi:hypothetical protein
MLTRQITLSGLVKRRFIHCIRTHGQTAHDVVESLGIPPGDLCKVIAGQGLARLPLTHYERIARWLRMPLANIIALAGLRPTIDDLMRLGMEVRGYRPTSADDQIRAAREVGISVAVFRRALHGYDDFRPSMVTCDRLARWLAWTGLEPDDIALAAGMVVRYRADRQRITLSLAADQSVMPYPCACGRPGCMIPAHIPSGPRRKWRSDACRMWAKRAAARSLPPRPAPIVRFIKINERPVPVRF